MSRPSRSTRPPPPAHHRAQHRTRSRPSPQAARIRAACTPTTRSPAGAAATTAGGPTGSAMRRRARSRPSPQAVRIRARSPPTTRSPAGVSAVFGGQSRCAVGHVQDRLRRQLAFVRVCAPTTRSPAGAQRLRAESMRRRARSRPSPPAARPFVRGCAPTTRSPAGVPTIGQVWGAVGRVQDRLRRRLAFVRDLHRRHDHLLGRQRLRAVWGAVGHVQDRRRRRRAFVRSRTDDTITCWGSKVRLRRRRAGRCAVRHVQGRLRSQSRIRARVRSDDTVTCWGRLLLRADPERRRVEAVTTVSAGCLSPTGCGSRMPTADPSRRWGTVHVLRLAPHTDARGPRSVVSLTGCLSPTRSRSRSDGGDCHDDPARIGSPPTLTAHHAPPTDPVTARGGFGSGCVLVRDYRRCAAGAGSRAVPTVGVARCGEGEP